MMASVDERSFNRMTWGEFVALLEPHGITVNLTWFRSRRLDFPEHYLLRKVPKPTTTYPLPRSYRTDAQVGATIIYAVCRHFGIEPRFPGWPLIM